MSHKKMQGTMIVLCLCLVLFGCSSHSYTTAARYTNYMDFSDSDPVDFILTGTFGWCDSDDSLVLESKD